MIRTMETLVKLGQGTNQGKLGLSVRPDGMVDLTGLKFPSPTTVGRIKVQPGGTALIREGKPKLNHCTLTNVDVSRASIGESIWEELDFTRVWMNDAKARDVIFASGSMKEVSFHNADLRDSHWGKGGSFGPVVEGADFEGADFRGSTFSHPLFRECHFVNARLKSVDFFGAAFENCVFRGLLEDVSFHGWDQDRRFVNAMKNVDFSGAELRFVGFSNGIDLTTCKFPDKGYMRVPHPQRTYQRALEIVLTEWQGTDKETGRKYLQAVLNNLFREEQPFDLMRPEDLIHSPLGRTVGMGIVRALERASEQQG